MKKTVLAAGGLIALAALFDTGRLAAQTQPTGVAGAPSAAPRSTAAPRTKIALMNLTYVIKMYSKYTTFQEEIKQLAKRFKDTEDDLRRQGEELSKQVTATTPAEQRSDIEKKLKEIQRKMEDNGAEAKLVLSRKSGEQMRIIYLDVVLAAQHYAREHDFDLVLHYNDAIEETDFKSSGNIVRKLQAGALIPVYAENGMDISKEVVELLNYKITHSAPPTAPQTPAGGTPR